MRLSNLLLAAALVWLVSAHAAEVRVDHAWMRDTLPGQRVAGGFLDLTADRDMRLVGASSPAARRVELHLMRIDRGRMEMREVASIPLPRGKTVSLAPGGLHLMLIDLPAPIKAGDRVPLTLTMRSGKGVETRVETALIVRARGE